MTELLSPLQLGFGTSGGMEAAIHAARLFIAESLPTSCLLKVDFKNAFNTLRRDRMLQSVKTSVPMLLPFVLNSYGAPSFLFYNDSIILSQEGVQQGDPLGPLLFCLTTHSIVSSLSSELKFFYLDDGTIGGPLDTILADFALIEREGRSLGLVLNRQKSEFICPDSNVCGLAAQNIPGIVFTPVEDASLLGAPIGSQSSVDESLRQKLVTLVSMSHSMYV